eukprot:INCI648.4.p1 GENE.INCI648.4~~INCI648.4.p1  ORF type:complete len:583 (+),score=95.29 INCI648.4:189-1937(+)
MEFAKFETQNVRDLAAKYFDTLQTYLLSPRDPPVEKAMCDSLEALLVAHPFVKAREVEHQTTDHRFHIVGFSCDVWSFRKWLKTPDGAPLKSKAGGVSDDGLYTLSALLREVLPRGLHLLTATHEKTGNVTTFGFRGIPKFSGLVASDEDEESHAEAAMFFFDGQTMEDVKEVYVTEKSNGENAKLSVRVLDGVDYLLAGSKQTCFIWPAAQPFAEAYPRAEPLAEGEDENIPGRTIATLFEDWFHSLAPELSRRVADEVFVANQTIVAEVNRPWAEHLVPINHLFMECYSLIGVDHRPVAPPVAFEILRSLGMRQADEKGFEKQLVRHVKRKRYALKSTQDLEALSTKCRRQTDSEGAVLYLLAPAKKRKSPSDGGGGSAGEPKLQTVGLVKVKTNTYVYRRRMRETIKSVLIRPLFSGEVRGLAPMQSACKQSAWNTSTFDAKVKRVLHRIRIGFANLTHLPDCHAMCGEWAEFGQGFVRDYLIPKFDELFLAAQKEVDSQQAPVPTVHEYIDSLPALPFTVSKTKVDASAGPIYKSLQDFNALFRSRYATMLAEYEARLDSAQPKATVHNAGGTGQKST